jgi:hypothetical protein
LSNVEPRSKMFTHRGGGEHTQLLRRMDWRSEGLYLWGTTSPSVDKAYP